MSELTSYVPGTPCWVDLAVGDMLDSAEFYGDLLGWEVPEQPNGAEMGGYRRALRDGDEVAGMIAGSAASGIASVSGTGSSHATSGPASSGHTAGSGSASYSPDGSTRRSRRDSAVRHALVAIWYSHVRTEDRPSKLSYERQARR